MKTDAEIRSLLARVLSWESAHVNFDAAVADLPQRLRGRRPPGLPHSPWELIEHLRLAQRDILEYCTRRDYHEQEWPADFWPPTAAPPSDAAWKASVRAFRKDRKALQALAASPKIDLHAAVPGGDGPTYATELLLAADHAAYHVGQLVLVRQLLGAWKRD